tara:strand:+ start:202 stop:1494 length:1293 start_codon:yes stop_codon:yes gene_type:complete
MKISIKNINKCRKEIGIHISSEIMINEHNETLNLYLKHASIPGFRKGKAPAKVVESKYAKEIKEDIKERILPKYYQEAEKESDLKIVNIIEHSEVEFQSDNSAKFSVTVDITPEFKLPKYTNIPIKTSKKIVEDKDIDEQINNLLNQYSTYEIDDEKKIEQGDMGQISYKAYVEEKLLSELIPESKAIASGKDYWVSADEHAFIPGMGEAIIGLGKGDKKEIPISFPSSFMVKELIDIKATYHVEILSIKVKKTAELTKEFYDQIQVESEGKLREIFRDQLENQAINEELQEKHNQIVSYLIKKTKLDVPESVVQQQTRDIMYDLARQKMMGGLSQEDISNKQEELLLEAKDKALENVKLRFIGLAIAEEQEFTSSNSEIDQEISNIAIQQRKDPEVLRKEMIENNTFQSISDQIKFNKAMDYMVDNAKK